MPRQMPDAHSDDDDDSSSDDSDPDDWNPGRMEVRIHPWKSHVIPRTALTSKENDLKDNKGLKVRRTDFKYLEMNVIRLFLALRIPLYSDQSMEMLHDPLSSEPVINMC